MKKVICWFLGHKWLYNFKTMPDKCICSYCKQKALYEMSGYVLDRSWEYVDSFEGETRTDDELIKQWIR